MDAITAVKKGAMKVFDFEASEVEELWDTDLWSESLIDSLGFVTLIAQLEDDLGKKIDLSSVNPLAIRSLCTISQMLRDVLKIA